jgi:hypothetical protein
MYSLFLLILGVRFSAPRYSIRHLRRVGHAVLLYVLHECMSNVYKFNMGSKVLPLQLYLEMSDKSLYYL